MPSLADMRTKAKEAGLMKLDKLIAKRQSIPSNEFPIPVKELCERYERLYTGCINDVMRELTLLRPDSQNRSRTRRIRKNRTPSGAVLLFLCMP